MFQADSYAQLVLAGNRAAFPFQVELIPDSLKALQFPYPLLQQFVQALKAPRLRRGPAERLGQGCQVLQPGNLGLESREDSPLKKICTDGVLAAVAPALVLVSP